MNNYREKIYFYLFILTAISLFSSSLFARRYNPFVWTTYRNFSRIYSIAIDMDRVYFGTDGGFLQFNRMKNSWDPPVTQSNNFKGSKALLVAIDRFFSKLWVVSDSALSIYIPQISFWEKTIPLTSMPSRSISSIGFNEDKVFIYGNNTFYYSKRGILYWQKWEGSLPQDIEWFGEKAKKSIRDYPFLTPYYVTDKYFNRYEYTALAVDKKDMWLGTDGFGIIHNNIYTWNGTYYLEGIANNDVTALLHDGDSFWCGGRNGSGKGITYINFTTGKGQYFRAENIYGINSDNVYVIIGNGNSIWFGTDEGLLLYDKDKDKWKTFSIFDGLPGKNVISLILKEDTLFIGTDEGLAFLINKKNLLETIETFKNIAINDFDIYQNNLIIATEKGVYIKKNKKFEQINDPDGDLNFGVAAVFVDSNTVWFGTIRHGVDVYYADSTKWQEYLSPTPISGDYIFAIAGDKNYIWIGTNNGVSRYNKKLKMWYTFNKTSGLADNKVRTIYVEKNYVWFGTKNGLTRFKYTDPSVPR